MKLLKKCYCPKCLKRVWVEDSMSGEVCPDCGGVRYLIDVWVAEGKWVEVETSHPSQYKMFKEKGGE